ncbi:uncharacterized protein TNCV_1561091 [Trichonephila clavipes]|nr:uncharacterized protein TNCV_1561091 [Trichonephila clavipes]
MEGLPYCNLYRSKFGDQKWVLLGFNRQGNSSVSDMRQAIWATYCHYRSTDEEPMHHFCPIGDTSWCKYQKAVATNSASLFKHKNIVPIAVVDEIKPIIAELSAPKLLKKCVCGG